MLKRCSSKFINLSQIITKGKIQEKCRRKLHSYPRLLSFCVFFFLIAFPISAPRDIKGEKKKKPFKDNSSRASRVGTMICTYLCNGHCP